jgi:hypothetical protein
MMREHVPTPEGFAPLAYAALFVNADNEPLLYISHDGETFTEQEIPEHMKNMAQAFMPQIAQAVMEAQKSDAG